MIGAEGTLGIITAACLRLFPAPLIRATAFLSLPNVAAALTVQNRLQDASGGLVEAFEYMPAPMMRQICAHHGKRGPMGYAVGELADLAIVTSDNPRSEDPSAIAEAVAEGVRAAGGDPLLVLDRRQAIRTALEQADERSLVLVAGKGHEADQVIGGDCLVFSDQEVVRAEAAGVLCR